MQHGNPIIVRDNTDTTVIVGASSRDQSTNIQSSNVNNQSLQDYLHTIVETNQGLSPRGFFQSKALISVNVPLDNIFIPLNVVTDRPLYDMPNEQLKLLEELRRNIDLSDEEREVRIQQLKSRWYSQLGQDLPRQQQKQNVTIVEVLQWLSAENPVAILLGTPGSGKSTTLRWFALHMAQASLLGRYRLPRKMIPGQIPILLHINDYAIYLSKSENKNPSFELFLFNKLEEAHPGLSIRLQDELKKGHCLLLFDGLDEVISDTLRRRIADAIFTFISKYAFHYSTAKSKKQIFNRFIITSRIVGYEPGIFARYAHYTLLDLKFEQIEKFLHAWCPAVERFQAMFAQGMRLLTQQQQEQAEAIGLEQQTRLLQTFTNNPGIMRLAVNPLMLTILALIQRSGRTLPHRRVELYQIVTRTLLDNWNKEQGRNVIEEIELAEQLLGKLAYLCWLLVASVGELDVSIASPLLFFHIQYAKLSEDFPC